MNSEFRIVNYEWAHPRAARSRFGSDAVAAPIESGQAFPPTIKVG